MAKRGLSNKSGQAAMEFLMTYGWAILVVLVAIGALAYFGVLSPDNFLPERCTGPAGLDCLDKASIDASTGNVTFVLKNNIGFNIQNLTVSGGTDDCTTTDMGAAGTQGNSTKVEQSNGSLITSSAAPNNRKITVQVDCVGGAGGFDADRFRSEISLSYVNAETSLSHKATISITGKAN